MFRIFIGTAVFLSVAFAQPRNEAMRATFEKMRQQAATSTKGPNSAKAAAPRVAPNDSLVGINLWRMRLAEASAPVKIRGFKQREDPTGARDWTPERLTMDQTIPEGDEIRIGVESLREGYLYLINRDVYADGTRSEPTLIVPTARIRGGNNLVKPGHPFEFPSIEDKPPTFSVERTRPDQTGILLTMILSPKPLAEITMRRDEQKLTEQQVSRWEKLWGTQVENTEDKSMLGKLYTMAEKTAASDPSKPLTGKDPVPVALFHRAGHSGEPIAATALVKVGPPRAPKE